MHVTLVVLAVLSTTAAAAPAPVTVYLERHGQIVERDDGRSVRIPKFRGSDRVWNSMVTCVKQQFAPFQIEISERKPASGEFITALVGGKASQLGLDDSTTNGIGPYDGEVQRDALVHIFSEVGTGETDAENLCAVTAHEVGHALGLDHSYQCGDIMSYFNDECGTQAFLDIDAPCGEESERACANGEATQNSYRTLVANVGLRDGAPEPRTEPEHARAVDADDEDDTVDADDTDEAAVRESDDADADDIDADDEDTAPAVPSPQCSGSSDRRPTASARSWRNRRRWN
jgi:hypothetical protein